MAFSNGDKVMKRTERLICGLFTQNRYQNLAIKAPTLHFPRITYHDAMQKYGSDKPDLRIPDEVSHFKLAAGSFKLI